MMKFPHHRVTTPQEQRESLLWYLRRQWQAAKSLSVPGLVEWYADGLRTAAACQIEGRSKLIH